MGEGTPIHFGSGVTVINTCVCAVAVGSISYSVSVLTTGTKVAVGAGVREGMIVLVGALVAVEVTVAVWVGTEVDVGSDVAELPLAAPFVSSEVVAADSVVASVTVGKLVFVAGRPSNVSPLEAITPCPTIGSSFSLIVER